MKKFCLSIAAIFFILGCAEQEISIDKIQLRQGKYYPIGTKNPYSGKVITTFNNGMVSGSYELKEGVPNGEWVTYGYQSETIQEGTHTPIDVKGEMEFLNDSIIRLSICNFEEGSSIITNIYIVSNAGERTVSKNEKLNVISFLKKHPSLIKADTINEITIITGELE